MDTNEHEGNEDMIVTAAFQYTEVQARREVVDVLVEEANQLALRLDAERDKPTMTHREKIAIGREMKRLRALATALKGD